jgi:membrane-associated phospholipid phosphatase
MLVNRRRALLISLALLLAAGVVFLLVAISATFAWVMRVDEAVLDVAVAVENRPATLVAEAFSIAGSVWVNWPLRIIAAIVLAVRRHWVQLTAFTLAVATSEILIGVLKSAYARPRPPGSLIVTMDYSFPSGHAVAGAVTAVGLVIVLLPPGRARWHWEINAVVISYLMAMSRVYLRAHWLADVVAGALLGAGLALGFPALLQAIRGRRDPAVESPVLLPERDDGT